MIKKIIRKIRTFTLLLKLAKSEAKDYTFGYKVRRILNLYRDNKDIKEEEIFKELPKP
jgi:hypothetical protein